MDLMLRVVVGLILNQDFILNLVQRISCQNLFYLLEGSLRKFFKSAKSQINWFLGWIVLFLSQLHSLK